MRRLSAMLSALVLSVFLFADDNLYKMSISGEGAVPEDYAPPFISNGNIATTIDNLGEQQQKTYHKIVPDIAWAGRRYSLPERDLFSFGHYNTEIKIDGKLLDNPKKWTQTLDVKYGYVLVKVEYDLADVITTAFVAQGADILAIEKKVILKKSTDSKVDITFKYSLTDKNKNTPQPRMLVKTSANKTQGIFNYTAYGYGIYNGQICVHSQNKVDVKASENSVSLSCVEQANGGVATASFFVDYADDFQKNKIAKTSKRHSEIIAQGFEKLFANHKAKWEAKQTSTYVNIPDVQMKKVFNTSLYFLRALKTKWSYPISLFTHGQHWNGAYFTWDEVFITAGLCAFGDFQHSRVAPDFRRKIYPTAKYRVDHKSGDFGIFYELSTREDGSAAAPQPFGFWMNHIFQNSSVASYCYWHWLFTHDKEYLKHVYPVIKGCAQYYYMDSIALDETGKLIVSKTLDLERLGPSCPNPFLTSCGIIYNFEIAARCADILGVDKDDAKKYREAANQLRKSLPNDGEKYVPRPDRNDKSIGCIGGIFPFAIFEQPVEMQTKSAYDFANNIHEVGNMYPLGKNVCTWYYTWSASALIRLGDRKLPYSWINQSAHNTGYFGEMWEINEKEVRMRPWFSTASGNYIHSVCTMLVSCRENGEVHIASATPENWKDFSFKLPTYSANMLEAKFENGKLVELHFKPTSNNADTNKTLVIAKKFVDAPQNATNWKLDGDNWRISVDGEFKFNAKK